MSLSNKIYNQNSIHKKFDLSESGIEKIIESIYKEGLSGMLILDDGAEKGEIYFKKGNIIFAQLGSLDGERAIFSFITWLQGKGNFILFSDDRFSLPEGYKENITYETPFLLDSIYKESLEISKMRDLLPSLDLIFEVIDTGTPMYIKTAELTVLPWVDGKTSVREIGQAMGREYTGVIKSIYKLVKHNIICRR
jgi:hypothetical protein